MTTVLKKPVRRKTVQEIRDRSKYRAMIVTLYPGGFMGIRLAKTRREETIPIENVYESAVKARVSRERMEKMNEKRKGKPWLARRGKL